MSNENMANEEGRKAGIKEIASEYGVITVGVLLVAAAVYFFMIPGNVIVGSLSGLVIVLTHVIPLPVSILSFVINAALLLLGFIVIGKEFGAKTIYTSTMMSVYLFIFEQIFPNIKSLTNDIIIDSAAYILVVSLGLAMLFNVNASSGGMDIVAKILNKYMHMEMGKAMTVVGLCVAFSAAFIYDTKSVIISLLATYMNGMVIDHFIDGFNRKKRICVLSEKYPEVQNFIVEELGVGVTIYKTIGGYNNKEQMELQTILGRTEYARLLEYLHVMDKKAFVTVSTTNEVIGGVWQKKRRKA